MIPVDRLSLTKRVRAFLNGSSVARPAHNSHASFVRWVLLSAIAFSTPVEAVEVGTTAGQFAVSPSGSASYSIPITVPPGVAGMQPSIAISYDSNAGNGLLGVGFSLSGLSQISRCPAALEPDGFIAPIEFDASDRFCLDGQRLVHVAGAYGSVGAEYRTEIEGFSKIVSYAGAYGDPGYFKVWTKDGHEMTYGGVSSARFDMAGASKALVWAINRITDTAGNSVLFQWLEATDSASGVPQRIDYAFSTSGQSAASVVFDYVSNRSDNTVAYVSGIPVRSTQLLSSITTYSFTTPVRTYALTSTYDGSAGEARLKSVQECAGTRCLPPTTFQWSVPTTYAQSQALNGPVHGVDSSIVGTAIDLSRVHFGDFDGDGRTDSYAINSWGNAVPAEINYGRADGSFTKGYGPAHGVYNSHEAAPVDLARVRVVDINADGLSDIYYVAGWSAGGTTPAILYVNKGNGVFESRQGPSHYVWNDHGPALNDLARVRYGDFNGDGLLDVYVVEGWGGQFRSSIYLNRDGVSFDPRVDGPIHGVYNSTEGVAVDIGRVKHGDFNGDGITDVYVVEGWNGSARATLHLSKGPAAFNTFTAATPIHFVGGNHDGAGLDLSRIKIADFNGDGLSDVIVIHGWNSASVSQVFLSRGNGTFEERAGPTFYVSGISYSVASGDIKRIHLVDVNGDGATDLYEANRDAGVASNVWVSRAGNSADLFVRQNGPSLPGASSGSGWISIAYLLSHDGRSDRANLSDFNGDGTPDIYYINGSGNAPPATVHYFTPGGDRVTQVTNGLGAQVALTYRPLTDASVHTKASASVYPVVEASSAAYVVSDQLTSNGSHSPRHVQYQYLGSRLHLRGRGWLGFSQTSTEDKTALQREVTLYRQDFPYIGMPYEIRHETSGNAPISRTQTTYSRRVIGTRVFPYARAVTVRDWEVSNGQLTRTTVTTNTYNDDYGNLSESLTEAYAGAQGSSEAYLTRNVNTYENDVSLWRLGRLTRAEVTRTRPYAEREVTLSATRVSAFEYDATTGLLSAEIVEPGSSFELRKDYERYRGNITSTTVTGPDIAGRTTSATFNQGYPYYGRFSTRTTNALEHFADRTFDPATGNIVTATDPNGVPTTLNYDSFGRATGESFNYAGIVRSTSIQRLWCSQVTVCGAGDVYVMRTTDSNGAEAFAVYDVLERQTRSLAKDPKGNFVQVLTEYDHLGRVARKSNPHFANSGTAYWSTYEYDSLGRLLKDTAPGSRVTRFAYAGLLTTQWDAGNHSTQQTSDVLGNVVSVQDAKGGTVERIYDAFGNLAVSIDAGGAITTVDYDIRGRKVGMQDPNMGRWVYRYNTLGELTEQVDAKGQAVHMVYDLLGRLIERVELEGITTWTYDTLRKGALSVVEGPNYRRSYTYLPWGAVGRETVSITSAPAPPDAGCAAPLSACGNLPPGVIPEDPVATVVGLLCAEYPGICEEPPLPSAEDVLGLITQFCSSNPEVCNPQAPDPLGDFCNSNPEVCDPQVPDPPPLDPPGIEDVQALIDQLCAQLPQACDPGVPPNPEDLVADLLQDICSAYPVLCGGIPEPPVEEIVGLIEALCASHPQICYGEVPPTTEVVEGLLGTLCIKYPAVCESLPDPEEDPAGAVVATLCSISSALCSPPPPDPNPQPINPKSVISELTAFLTGLASNPCGWHTYGPISINTWPICDSLPAPPPLLFASASTAPGTALFGPRVSAGLPTDNATMVQFSYSYAYDTSSRQSEITYPSGLKVKNNYSPTNGALTKVTRSQSGQVYWEAMDWDAWGNNTLAKYGNGIDTSREYDPMTGDLTGVMAGPGRSASIQYLDYGWDADGNLSYRQDGGQEWLREDFAYDQLHRVTSATLSNVPGVGTLQGLSMTYGANGNIESKSGVGDYVYGTQPHAAVLAGSAVYAYDPNGNMVTGAGRSYTLASYNLPLVITNGTGTSEFLYGTERQRVRQLSTDITSAKLIYYVGSLYEEHQQGSVIEKKHYISTPAGVVAIETWAASTTLEYLHRDHLGSVVAITDASGALRQRMAYDVFGKRRGVIVDSAVAAVTGPFLTARGFTGHEHLDNLDLVHMNGRVYDPLLGRFTSADPLVQAPGLTQSHNRYAYVMNNPLTLTDPSGFSWWGKQVNRLGKEVRRWESDFRHEIRRPNSNLGALVQIAAVASCIAGPECAAWLPAVAAATSVAVARAQGVTDAGDLARTAFVTAWTTQAFIAVGGYPSGIEKVIAHGLVGGVSTAASGGDFGSGFLAGAISAIAAPYISANPVIATLESAVIGGTAAKLGGGKFANGAVTGAFAYAYGRAAQKIAEQQQIEGIKVYRKEIDIGGEDKYGHWWIEIDGVESYGWWPKEPVGLGDTLFGTAGELNGQTSFGGTPTMDPHPLYGKYEGADAYNVYGDLTVSKAQYAAMIRGYAQSYSGSWSWPIGQNCHSFQKGLLDQLGLTIRPAGK